MSIIREILSNLVAVIFASLKISSFDVTYMLDNIYILSFLHIFFIKIRIKYPKSMDPVCFRLLTLV